MFRKRKITHPAKAYTSAQLQAFEWIATNHDEHVSPQLAEELKAKGLLESFEHTLEVDPPVVVTHYLLPPHVHGQYLDFLFEQANQLYGEEQ